MYWSVEPMIRQIFIFSIILRLRFELIGAALHLKDDISDMDNNLFKIIFWMNYLINLENILL